MRLLFQAVDVALQFAVLCWRKLDDALLRRTLPPRPPRPFSAIRLAVLVGLLLAPLAWSPRAVFLADRDGIGAIVCPVRGPRPRPAAQPVTLFIASEPAGARIAARVDGSGRECSAPCEVTASEGSLVELEARLPGYATWRSTVLARADQVLRADLRAAQLP
jgi:hypothetical protein